jgi:ACS family hexuronate transporter-like MFS transporter
MENATRAGAGPRPADVGVPVRLTNYRWLICALLFFATTINYIDRQILSLLKEVLDQRIGWSNEQFGWANAAFQLAYGIGLLGFGWFVDRFGVKIGYALSIASWSIVAPAMVPWLADRFGWQSAFIVTGLAGLLWLGLWLPLYDVPERNGRVSSEELEYILEGKEAEQDGTPVRWLELLGYRQTWSFIIAKFLTDPVWWFFLIWLPDFFYKTRGLEIKRSWAYILTIYGIVTVLSVFGGWVTGYLTGRGWSVTRARKTGMFLFALCVMPIVVVTKAGNWSAVLLIGIAASAHQAWSANLFTTVSDMFPKAAVASVVGLGGMAGATGGFLFPILTGRMLDRFAAVHNITAGYSVLFTICGCSYVVAFGLNHLLASRFEPFVMRRA